ncbi:MAG: ATP-grasp domain-containing protein [Pirellula sp.]|jgi:hypothetical protein
MKVFLQNLRPDSSSFLVLQNAEHWFWERGYEIGHFSVPDLSAGLLDPALLEQREETILFAIPEVMRMALRRLNHAEPPLFELPDCLMPWIGRFTWETTLGQVRDQVDSEIGFNPFHIRPLDSKRIFKGTIVYGLRDLIPSASLANETPVLAQQKVEFVSEWRAFVFRDKVIHLSRTKGDVLRYPDREVMLAAINTFTNRSIVFGMDWGITASGQTLLIDVNDGIAAGNLGMHGQIFAAMIEAKWRNWIGLADNGIGDCFTR